MVDSARFRFVKKKLSNGVRSTAETGDGPSNQCQGSEENRGHAKLRVGNTSLDTALACRIHFHSDKRVKSGRFLTPGTFRNGPPFAKLATEVLEMGGTFEEADVILGDSEAIIRKHYANW